MMTIYIKCVFKNSYYSLRRIKVKTSSGGTYYVGHEEVITINSGNDEWLDFRLDYHKHRFTIDRNTNDQKLYLVVMLEFRDKFPFSHLDVMFRNCMRVKAVDKFQFDNYENTIAITKFTSKEYSFIDYFTCTLCLLIFLGYTVMSVIYEGIDDRNFIFIIGIAGVFSSLRLIILRKSISSGSFDVVIRTSSFINLILLIFLDVPTLAKVLFLGISVLLFLIDIYNKHFQKVDE